MSSARAADSPIRRRRLSIADYRSMATAGILSERERIELIDGEIVDMNPIGGPHVDRVKRLTGLLVVAVGERAVVSVQNPLQLPNDSEPEPDLVLLRPRRSDGVDAAVPTVSDAPLVIEVADSTLRYDRDVKMPLYARHRVPDAWLIDVRARSTAESRRALHFGFVLSLLSLTIGWGPASADAGHCDPGLEPRAGHPFSYGPRDGRCEGVYVQDVSVPVLRLIAFTQSAPPPGRLGEGPARIAWTLADDAPLRIRAQSLRPRLYYRMDTVQPAVARAFLWPMDIVQALDLAGDELGVLAWGQGDERPQATRVYTPIAIDLSNPADKAGPEGQNRSLRVGMFIGRELEEVFVRVLKQVDGAEAFEIFQPRRPLGLGYYPAGRPITIDLPPPTDSGRYLVQVGAQQTSGGSATTEFAFQWAGWQTP